MRRDLRNLIALSSIQASNALLPLVIFPFILYIAGPAKYTELVVAEGVAMVLLPFVLYSFEIDGVAKVLALRNPLNRPALARLVGSILCIRSTVLLLIAFGIVVVAIIFSIPRPYLYIAWLSLPLSHVLQSTWLFQGLERNEPLACCIVGSRVLAVIMVVMFVKNPEDTQWVPIIVGGLYSLGGLASLIYIAQKLDLKFEKPSMSEMRFLLAEGKQIFLGNVAVVLYRDSNVLLLGSLGTHPNGIAAYSIAEKIVKCVQAAMRPLNQLYLPRALKITREARLPSKSSLRKLWKITAPQILWLLLGTSIIGTVYVMCGKKLNLSNIIENQERISVLIAIMITAVFFGISNFMLGTAGLNYLGEQKYYLRAIAVSGSISILVCAAASIAWGEFGAAIAYVLAEVLLFTLVLNRYTLMRYKEHIQGPGPLYSAQD